MAVSLKQLAQELGLDYSTVSYALSGKGSVSDATRQRVREAADRLGYVPNGLVRRMQAKQTKTLGLVLPDSILLYNELIQQLYRGANERGYDLRIALTEFQIEAEERAVRALMEDRVDGFIIRSRYGHWAEVPPNAALRQAVTQKLPVVTYGPTLAESPFPSLNLPVGDRTRMVTQHLLADGHRHIACLLPTDLPIYGPHISAIEGIQGALTEIGLGADLLNVLTFEPQNQPDDHENPDAVYGNYLNEILPEAAVERGRALMRQVLELSPRPTALICYNAVIAIGVLQECQAQGLAVPDDMAVTTVSRSLVADLAPISLTSCDIAAPAVAEAVLSLLLEVVEQRLEGPLHRTIPPTLKIGRTTLTPTKAASR